MKKDICDFVKKVCYNFRRYNLHCVWIPDNDVYMFHINGKGIMTFDTVKFYELPKRMREEMILPLIQVGLVGNLGEKNHDALAGIYKIGKKIC